MNKFVLDAWAILALLQGEEPAANQIKQLLEEAQTQQIALYISIINLGEVFYQVGKVKGESEARQTLSQIGALNLSVISATESDLHPSWRLPARRWRWEPTVKRL